MGVSCVWVTTAEAATLSTIAEAFFTAPAAQGGDTYYRQCGADLLINGTLANTISLANGGDPVI